MEVTTSEEIHCICLFPDLGKAAAFSRWLDSLRPGFSNRPAVFGRQTVMGSTGRRTEERELLFMARRVSLTELPGAVRQYRRFVLARHVDKPSNSLYSILGCWPEDFQADAAELYFSQEPAGIPASIKRLPGFQRPPPPGYPRPRFPLPLESPRFYRTEKLFAGLTPLPQGPTARQKIYRARPRFPTPVPAISPPGRPIFPPAIDAAGRRVVYLLQTGRGICPPAGQGV